MSNEQTYRTRARIVQLLFLIVESPKRYSKAELIQRFGAKEGTIKGDFKIFRNLGLDLRYDSNYRYYFTENKVLRQFKDLLYFSEEDRLLLTQAIDHLDKGGKRGERLKRKLDSLYNFSLLGHDFLRSPYLAKIELLRKSAKFKKQVILQNYYSSSSNKISDRLVECFHIQPDADTLQAYEPHNEDLRHFRISRLKGVLITNDDWKFEKRHHVKRTDPFRIVDDEQIPVHLRLKIGARNELIERFPLTKNRIMETQESNVFDFQADINHKFLGLTNFILGFHHQLVEICSPDILIDHLNEEIKKMHF